MESCRPAWAEGPLGMRQDVEAEARARPRGVPPGSAELPRRCRAGRLESRRCDQSCSLENLLGHVDRGGWGWKVGPLVGSDRA